ncbi:MAG: hypothetical protein MUE78_03360, partial [Ilumatobacteraceae bacterium]|nr:hypothetical protein [Ilumatobacteraceae bacterium]
MGRRTPAKVITLVTVAAALVATAVVTATVPAPRAAAAPGVSCAAPEGPLPPTTSSGGFRGIQPTRLVDTRDPGGSPVPARCWLRVAVPASVPATATALALTVTADRSAIPAFLTVHPCGSSRPLTSNVNTHPSGPTANLVVVGVDATREICVYSQERSDVIVDLVGWFGADGLPFQETEPRRVVDTRSPATRPPGVTGKVVPGRTVELSRSLLGLPDSATSVMVNVTATEADGYGFVTTFPCGGAAPPTSNVNYLGGFGVARANTTISALGATGSLCLTTSVSATHLIVDVIGWFGGSEGLDLRAAAGRLADSRDGTGGWSTPFAPGEERRLVPAASGLLPDGTRVAVLGVVATRTATPGFLQLLPCGSTSQSSSLNVVPGIDITNLVTVPLADDGSVCVRASMPTDVVIDVFGGFRADGAVRSFALGGADLFPA